ncbi:MAG: LptF/LptG family permease [Pirellulales bacterium]
MRILTRYVFFDLLAIFLVSLAGMTAVMLIAGVGREAVRQGLGLVPVLRLIPYVLPDAMRFAVPGTMLLATTSVYGRMAAFNEVVAVKSLGISPMVLLWPVLVLSTLISFATVWLNDVAVSWGRAGVQRVVVESVEQIAYGMLRTQRSYSTKRLSINVKAVEDHVLIQPSFRMAATADREEIYISADMAELHANPVDGTLTIIFQNARGTIGEGGVVLPGRETYVLPLDEFSRQGAAVASTSDIPLRAIGPEIETQEQLRAALNQEFATRAAHQMMLGDFEGLTSTQWKDRRDKLEKIEVKLHRLHTEPHRRWANGFSCLCFVLIGAPMAIRRRHGEFLASFFACFLPILLVYYPLLMYGVERAKYGALPPQFVWLGNVLLVVWGLWMLRKVIRH